MEKQLKSLTGLIKGDRVEHNLLGKGTVCNMDNTHNVAVCVHFDNYQGNAQWMLDATLKKIEE